MYNLKILIVILKTFSGTVVREILRNFWILFRFCAKWEKSVKMALSDADVQKQVNNMCKLQQNNQKRVLWVKQLQFLQASVVSMPKRESKSWDSRPKVMWIVRTQLFHSQNMHLSNLPFNETQVKYSLAVPDLKYKLTFLKYSSITGGKEAKFIEILQKKLNCLLVMWHARHLCNVLKRDDQCGKYRIAITVLRLYDGCKYTCRCFINGNYINLNKKKTFKIIFHFGNVIICRAAMPVTAQHCDKYNFNCCHVIRANMLVRWVSISSN